MNNLIALFKTRRFAALFYVQFLGAFSDNVFKSALLILITYQFSATLKLEASVLNMLAAGLFILPFFLMSAFGGMLADKFAKHRLIRLIKLFELTILAVSALAFIYQIIWLLFVCLCLAGLQSALFGPCKYAILPELLEDRRLLSANALVEAGTFLSILLGTMVGGLLILTEAGAQLIAIVLIACAGLGWWSSFFIPALPAAHPQLKLHYNIFRQTFDIYRLALKQRQIRRLVLAISWFWFLGYVIHSQLNPVTAQVLLADEKVAVLLLIMFTVGIGLGSLLCSRISGAEISARWVPLAAVFMSLFSIDLYWALNSVAGGSGAIRHNISAFLADPRHWRVLADMLLLSVAAGFYIVPLYTLLQKCVEDKLRARTIAANNISNAMFMVSASILVIIVLSSGFGMTDLFWMLAILNFIMAVLIMKIIPEQSLKTFGRLLFKVLYRVDVRGLENFPTDKSPCVIVSNHVSFLDGPLLMSYLPEMPVFAINTAVNKKWWAKIFTRFFEMYPLDSGNPMAVKGLIKMLRAGRKVVIFPEGRITSHGSLMKVYEGPAKIAQLGKARLIPVRIDGAQSTPFGRLRGLVKLKLLPKITITICPPQAINTVSDRHGSKTALRRRIYDVMTNMMYQTSRCDSTLYNTLCESLHIYGRKHQVLEDLDRKAISLGGLLLASVVLGRLLSRTLRQDQSRRRPVGMLLPNAIPTAVTFYALQAIAAVPAMLNFSAGKSSLLSALKTAQINTVITSRKFIQLAQLESVEALLLDNVKLIYLEDLKQQISLTDKLAGLLKTRLGLRRRQADCHQPAVILFTSGSEGLPKGVVLSHKNLLANQAQVKSCLDFSSQDCFFNALPLFHSFGLGVGLILPVSSGIKTFLYPSPLHYKIIPNLVYDIQASVMFGTDTFLSAYARHADPEDFQFTRYVIAGAEKLKAATRDRWMTKFGVRIFEGYGVTETSPALSMNNYSYCKLGTAGRMFPGIEAKIEKVPGIEAGGRLWVKGDNIMLGYLRADQPGQLQGVTDGWHDTGDIVNIDDEGFVSILGRAKRFAKVGGEMVSLTQVEAWVAGLWPQMTHCVCAVADERKGEKLVLVTSFESADRKTIQQYITDQGGAEIMAPREVLYMRDIPVLATGKLDYPEIQKRVNEKYLPEG